MGRFIRLETWIYLELAEGSDANAEEVTQTMREGLADNIGVFPGVGVAGVRIVGWEHVSRVEADRLGFTE